MKTNSITNLRGIATELSSAKSATNPCMSLTRAILVILFQRGVILLFAVTFVITYSFVWTVTKLMSSAIERLCGHTTKHKQSAWN